MDIVISYWEDVAKRIHHIRVEGGGFGVQDAVTEEVLALEGSTALEYLTTRAISRLYDNVVAAQAKKAKKAVKDLMASPVDKFAYISTPDVAGDVTVVLSDGPAINKPEVADDVYSSYGTYDTVTNKAVNVYLNNHNAAIGTVATLKTYFPAAFEKSDYKCPATTCQCQNPYNSHIEWALTHLIVHLNDDVMWTREQIADWLDSLDIDQYIKVLPGKGDK